MSRPLLLVIALDVVGVIGVIVAGFAHQQGDRGLMTAGIVAIAVSAVAGALTLFAWSRARRRSTEDAEPGLVVREL